MGVVEEGRHARTHYSVIQRHHFTSLAELKLETGRTHQIRVHMQHLGHPVFGDPVYAGRERTEGIRPEMRRRARWMLSLMKRQELHARQLRFCHPSTGETMAFCADWPADMRDVIEAARIRDCADS